MPNAEAGARGTKLRSTAARLGMLGLLALALTHCDEPAPSRQKGASHGDDAKHDDTKEGGSGRGDKGSGSSKSGGKASISGSGERASSGSDGSAIDLGSDGNANAASASGSDLATEVTESVYPTLGYSASGYTTYKMDKHLDMVSTSECHLSQSELSINTLTAHISCGNLNHCEQDDVDARVQKHSIGTNTYVRTPPDQSKALVDAHGAKPSYAIFANGLNPKNGYHFVFDHPIPVFPLPAALARYKALDAGPSVWTTSVTSDRGIPTVAMGDDAPEMPDFPNLPGFPGGADFPGGGEGFPGQTKKQFQMTTTVTKAQVDASHITITFLNEIPGDDQRLIYKYLEHPRSAVFTIDIERTIIESIQMTSWGNGDKSTEPEETVLLFKLCSKKTGADVATYPCQ